VAIRFPYRHRLAILAGAGVTNTGTSVITGDLGTHPLVMEGPGEVANAQNRRDQFRLLIADPYLVAPEK